MSKYADIIARLEKAEGADRKIDYMIFTKTAPLDEFSPWSPLIGNHFTSSIDAAIALVDRMLKTYWMEMTVDPSGGGAKILYWPNGISGEIEIGPVYGASTDLPLAILLALFCTLDAQETLK